jgi:hypothetical protein
MSKQKRTKKLKWAIACDDCYREQYCPFVLDADDADNCILFRSRVQFKEDNNVNTITK